MDSIENKPGCYVLVLYLPEPTAVVFDRKGTSFDFETGWYVYVGSALGGLQTRLKRHHRTRRDAKKMHWNVDYFREYAELHEVWYSFSEDSEPEHSWAHQFHSMAACSVPVAKFGASDCKSGCIAHFFQCASRPIAPMLRSGTEQSRSFRVCVEPIRAPSGQAALDQYVLGS